MACDMFLVFPNCVYVDTGHKEDVLIFVFWCRLREIRCSVYGIVICEYPANNSIMNTFSDNILFGIIGIIQDIMYLPTRPISNLHAV